MFSKCELQVVIPNGFNLVELIPQVEFLRCSDANIHYFLLMVGTVELNQLSKIELHLLEREIWDIQD